jgi:hypothetical protein
MGAILTELVETGEKRDGRGRRIVTEDHRQALSVAYAKSGLTQRAFAEREGVNYHTLVEWLGRYRQRKAAKPDPRFRELSLGDVLPPPVKLEVRLPGGIVVCGENALAVAELVRALRC